MLTPEGVARPSVSRGNDTLKTLKEVKEKVLLNCVSLEKEKLCSRADNFQAILNSVAQDIRN
jgi:hypothetical protein